MYLTIIDESIFIPTTENFKFCITDSVERMVLITFKTVSESKDSGARFNTN
jgi:hypothetical protein